jgi:hypothetical protein
MSNTNKSLLASQKTHCIAVKNISPFKYSEKKSMPSEAKDTLISIV